MARRRAAAARAGAARRARRVRHAQRSRMTSAEVLSGCAHGDASHASPSGSRARRPRSAGGRGRPRAGAGRALRGAPRVARGRGARAGGARLHRLRRRDPARGGAGVATALGDARRHQRHRRQEARRPTARSCSRSSPSTATGGCGAASADGRRAAPSARHRVREDRGMPAVDGLVHPRRQRTEGAPCQTSSPEGPFGVTMSRPPSRSSRRSSTWIGGIVLLGLQGDADGGGGVRRQGNAVDPRDHVDPVRRFMLIVSYGLLRGNSVSRIAATVRAGLLARVVDLDRRRASRRPSPPRSRAPSSRCDPAAALVGEGHPVLQGPCARRADAATSGPRGTVRTAETARDARRGRRWARPSRTVFVPLDRKPSDIRFMMFACWIDAAGASMKECCG